MNLPTAEGIIAMCKARLLVLALSALPALGQSLPADWHVDKTLYPKAYGLLDNEQLMFPVDMSDWPVRIDGAHQLFVDDYLMASAENITRQVHPARKHPANPVMRGEHPWEGIGPMFPIVRRDEKTGRFRMWYAGWTRYPPCMLNRRTASVGASPNWGCTPMRAQRRIISLSPRVICTV